jgi:phosphoenolpyruvate-protein kinase (PTS system EI component)
MMFTGAMIAPGIAFGPAVVWTPEITPVPRREISAASVPAEEDRLEHALR